MDGGIGSGGAAKLDLTRERPWWCAECASPALVESWRAYGVCDPCANRLRAQREGQASRRKRSDER